jgi:RNA polymerase sigma-70 factor (ECF subfamily)
VVTRRTERTSSDLGDEALLVHARGDAGSFAVFYDRHHPGVHRFFALQSGSRHLAEELSAETFAEALASLGRFDPSLGSGSGWLYAIAHHQWHRFLRRGEVDQRHRHRLRVVVPPAAALEVERVIDVADAHSLRPRLTSALAGLSDPIRSAVLLRVAAELPYAEVAALLGCTEGTARMRVKRGLHQLSHSMERP